MQIEFPSAREQKILRQEAPGEAPERVEVVIPSAVATGEAFDIRVAVLDATGYPSIRCGEELVVSVPGTPEPTRVRFEPGRPAVASLRGATLAEKGFQRCRAEIAGRRFYSNAALVGDGGAERIYWGDPHVHTILSRCSPKRCRSLNFCFTAARHVAGLDWVSAADHVSNGRCDVSKWLEQKTVADLYNDDGTFVTLPAYEASFKGGAGGDNNVYMRRFPDLFVDDYDEGSVRTMAEKLVEQLPEPDFFVVPHHTTRTGKHGELPDGLYLGESLMPVVEVHSKWGSSEYRGNPEPLEKIHPGPSYVVDLLNQGMRFGLIGGTDTHSTMPFGYGVDHLRRTPGATAVRCGALSRDAVFDAIRNRDCYAVAGERVYLGACLGEVAPGRSVRWADARTARVVSGKAAAKGDITRIDLVRNGETIRSISPESWHAEFRFADEEELTSIALDSPHLQRFVYYYVRVRCASGARAWSSPWWVVERS